MSFEIDLVAHDNGTAQETPAPHRVTLAALAALSVGRAVMLANGPIGNGPSGR